MLILLLTLAVTTNPLPAPASQRPVLPRTAGVQKQLAAVRGEIVTIKTAANRMLFITVRPARDYAEITVLARENDLVGTASGRESGDDLFGLLAGGDPREEETITAAELNQGDVVSVIFDPQAQNRVIEIYVH